MEKLSFQDEDEGFAGASENSEDLGHDKDAAGDRVVQRGNLPNEESPRELEKLGYGDAYADDDDNLAGDGDGEGGGVGVGDELRESEGHDCDVDRGRGGEAGDGKEEEKEEQESAPAGEGLVGSEVDAPIQCGDGSEVEPLQPGVEDPSRVEESGRIGGPAGSQDGLELLEGTIPKLIEIDKRIAEEDEAGQAEELPERNHARELEEGWKASQQPSDNDQAGGEPIETPSSQQTHPEDLNRKIAADDREGDLDKEESGGDGNEQDREASDLGAGSSDSPPGARATSHLGAAGPSLAAEPIIGMPTSSTPAMESAPRRTGGAGPSSNARDDGHSNGEAAAAPESKDETREKLHVIRIKLLRIASRLGQSPRSPVVAQVLYRLGLAEQLRGNPSTTRNGAYSLDTAIAIAAEEEAASPEGPLDFTCTILLLGRSGVGKSATVNSLFDELKVGTDAFKPATKKVQVVTGQLHGCKVRVIDTPGLRPSILGQGYNRKALASVKWFIRKRAPDIVLYFDRLDLQSRGHSEVPMLQTITETFGSAVWFNAIVVLTHASSATPDGPTGLPIGYEMLLKHRSNWVQHTIRQAAGDKRLMNPVALVENNPACRVNRLRERVLPNGQVWKPHLLLLCFASKILADANSILKLEDSPQGKAKPKVPPLPFLLSALLQSRSEVRIPDEQGGEGGELAEDLEEEGEEDEEEDEDYDQLPSFRRLSKEELAELDKDNRGKYFEELAERERLFLKKQWKEEKKRRRELKEKMAAKAQEPMDQSQFEGDGRGLEGDMTDPSAVAVPMPDMVLPPSFDSDNPTHRYRYLETANQWIVRPVLEQHGWDHDNGYDGLNVEKVFVIGNTIPASVSGQIIKDKKDLNVNLESAATLKLGEGKATTAGLDVQTVGKDMSYMLRSETGFNNFKGNKTIGGLAATLIGNTLTFGMKMEDRLVIGKRVKLVLSGGTVMGHGDAAYGGSLEATLRGKDYPLSRTLSSVGVSVMDWHGDLAIGGNLQSEFMLGKTMMVGRANLNNRGSGELTIKASSSEQVWMTLIGLLPLFRSLANHVLGLQSKESQE